MKSKKFVWAMLPLSAAMLLASCGVDTPASSSSADPAPRSSEVTPPAPSSEQGSVSQGPQSDSHENVDHRDGLVKDLAEGAVTRDFDERFDQSVEDFSGDSLSGTSEAAIHKGILREVVDSNLPSFQNSPNAAIFKMASASFGGDPTLLAQGSIHFKMRVTEGKLPLSDLIFGVRPSNDSSDSVYPIKLSEALNADSVANPELTDEFQDISVSIGDSIEDEATVFPGTELQVLTNAVGFHLYVKGDAEVSAVLEIAEVYFQKGDAVTMIDDFARDGLSGNPNVYWGPTDCADAVLIRRGLSLAKTQKYTTPALSEDAAGKTHVVFSALGDLSGTKVAVKYDDSAETTDTKEFKDLGIVNAVNGAYANLAIDLSKFAAPEGAKPKTITLENAGDAEVQIANVFMTSFEVPDLNKAYPSIDAANAVTFDNFERNFASLGADYNASHTDPRNVDAGIYHFLSYSHGDKISTSDGVLHLPGTEEGNPADYDNVNIGSSHVMKGAKYIVFSIRGEAGFDLSGLRFKMSDSGKEVSFGTGLAMEGVKAYNDEAYQTPYEDGKGFKWYVFDLALNGVEAMDTVFLYYTGVKNIDIDSIFYANDFFAYNEKSVAPAATEVDLSAYSYLGGLAAEGADYFTATVKGDGVATLHTFRAKYNGTSLWMKDGLANVYDASGRKVSETDIIPEVETTYYFDLSSGYPEEGDGWCHLEAGKFFSGEGKDPIENYGKITVVSLGTAKKGVKVDANAAAELNFAKADYAYVSGWDATVEAKTMSLHVSGDGTNDLSLFRIEQKRSGTKVGEFWANATSLIKDASGSLFDINTKIGEEGVDLVLDLASAGIEVKAGDTIHFHINSIAPGKLSFGAAKAVAAAPSASMAIGQYVQSWAK